MFSTLPGKVEKESNILGNDKLLLSPAYRIEDPLEFCDYSQPFVRSVDISRYLHFKKVDLENVGEGHDVQQS